MLKDQILDKLEDVGLIEPKTKKRDYLYLNDEMHVISGSDTIHERRRTIIGTFQLDSSVFHQGKMTIDKAAETLDLPSDELTTRLMSNLEKRKRSGQEPKTDSGNLSTDAPLYRKGVIYYRTREG